MTAGGDRRRLRAGLAGLAAGLALVAAAPAAEPRPEMPEEWRAWNRPVEPFRIAGELYYVGTVEMAAYLFATPEGHVLLDGGFAESAPLIAASIEKLGFALDDVEILISSHGHVDHAGGLARLAELTGAEVVASAGDRPLLESGGGTDPDMAAVLRFPPVEVDRVVADGDRIELGGLDLTARLTPGHTPGCTSWTARIPDGERTLDAVFVCSVNVLSGTPLVGNERYPTIALDFASSFATLRAQPCDLFLGAHASFFRMEEKLAARDAGAGDNPFVDPDGYRRYIDQKDRAFRDELERQRAAAGDG